MDASPQGNRSRAKQAFMSQGWPWPPGIMMRVWEAPGPSCTSLWGDKSHEGLSSAHPTSSLSGGSQQGFVIDPRVDHPWMDRAERGLEPGLSRVGAQVGTVGTRWSPAPPPTLVHPRPQARS